MSILEQRIKKNKELFDVNEPQEGHLSRFEERLAEIHKEDAPSGNKRALYQSLRIAASVVFILSISMVLYLYNNGSTLFAAERPAELQELSTFYMDANQQKITEIEELCKDNPEAEFLREDALTSMDEFQDESKELEKEYMASNKDRRVFGAIIKNYQYLGLALDKIIDNLNDVQDKKNTSF